jgi:hypothetical protein
VRHLGDDPRHGINLGLIADEGRFLFERNIRSSEPEVEI